MFGALRFLLAYLVVLSHLVGSDYLAHFGFYAVRGFFVLSGFVITAALNEVYGFDAGRFWANRLLRLLPPYYLVCLVTLAVLAFVPADAGQFLSYWRADPRQNDMLMNLSVLPMQFSDAQLRIVPPYWSVAIEIEMYFLLWIVIARRPAFAAMALAAGISYHLACIYDGFPWTARYFTAPSATLSFSLGALVYFCKQQRFPAIGLRGALLAFAVWALNMTAAWWILPDSYAYGVGYYLNTLAFALMVYGFAGCSFGSRVRAWDRRLGELAYPVFLLQWLAGFVTALVLFPGTGIARGWAVTLAATPVILLGAAGLAFLHRVLVEPLRARLREARPDPQPVGVTNLTSAAE
jgi:peptidoglycan/LPS O-acetylase OafA/YrhL